MSDDPNWTALEESGQAIPTEITHGGKRYILDNMLTWIDDDNDKESITLVYKV